MKVSKKVLSIFLVVLMIVSTIPIGIFNVSSIDSPVKTILDKVESVYGNGTYFTANRKACNHSSGKTCDNCKLATILNSEDCKKIKRFSNGTYNSETWTCFSFVSFCFTQCFGKSYIDTNYNKAIDSNDLFSGRTDFSNQSVAKKKEFFSYGKIGDIIKCFRYAKGDDGNYHYYHKHSMVFISSDSTGVTVFDANVGGDDNHTGTVRKAKIKYENIQYYNIEILHAKNYNDVVGYQTITFNGNGGTPSKTSETFAVGEEYGDAFPSATGKEGYSFDGWYTSASGGTRHRRDTVVSTDVKTLYAHWIKNSTNVLKVNHVYKIYNEKSRLPWQTNGSDSGSYVCQRAESSSSSQLWRVTYADNNGYYRFESLYGGMALDMCSSPQFGYKNHLQIYTPNNNTDAQMFSLVYRAAMDGTTGLYTIHSKWSGRTVNVDGASLQAGAVLNQWDYHGYGQKFYFVEETNRNVTFYDNHSNNYITPLNSSNYNSREPSAVTTNIKNDLLEIVQTKSGGSSADLLFRTNINSSEDYDFSIGDSNTYEFHFKAKSTVSGAKMFFRWGYGPSKSIDDYVEVKLTDSWKTYVIVLERDSSYGNCLHPFVDTICTVQMKDMVLCREGDYHITTESADESHNTQEKAYNINTISSETFPKPLNTKQGYVFDGWYTARVGGEMIADANGKVNSSFDFCANVRAYAHWKNSHTHTIVIDKAVNETCLTSGLSQGSHCSECGEIIVAQNTIPALGHTSPDSNGKCTRCGQNIVNVCKWCGGNHDNGFFQKIIGLFHNIFAAIFGAKY